MNGIVWGGVSRSDAATVLRVRGQRVPDLNHHRVKATSLLSFDGRGKCLQRHPFSALKYKQYCVHISKICWISETHHVQHAFTKFEVENRVSANDPG